MLTELCRKAGRVCREAKKGNIRCGLIIRPTSEDVITGNLCQALRILNPRWWLPDLLNQGLRARRFRRQIFRDLRIEPWRNRPHYPRELLPWNEGSTEVDLTIRWENPPTTVYLEMKYLADLSPRVTNGQQGFPSDQFIRNARVGLLESGWFHREELFSSQPRDFVLLLVAPTKGHELVHYYRDTKNLLGAIPHSEKLRGLPKSPFVGELTYGDIMRILSRQRSYFTRPERQMVDDLIDYLAFKLQQINAHESQTSKIII